MGLDAIAILNVLWLIALAHVFAPETVSPLYARMHQWQFGPKASGLRMFKPRLIRMEGVCLLVVLATLTFAIFTTP